MTRALGWWDGGMDQGVGAACSPSSSTDRRALAAAEAGVGTVRLVVSSQSPSSMKRPQSFVARIDRHPRSIRGCRRWRCMMGTLGNCGRCLSRRPLHTQCLRFRHSLPSFASDPRHAACATAAFNPYLCTTEKHIHKYGVCM